MKLYLFKCFNVQNEHLKTTRSTDFCYFGYTCEVLTVTRAFNILVPVDDVKWDI
jgi:hypothetical protein